MTITLVALAEKYAVDGVLDTRKLTEPEYEAVVEMLLSGRGLGREVLPGDWRLRIGPVPRSQEEFVGNGGSWLPCEGPGA